MADPFIAEIRICGFTFAPRGWAFCDGRLLPISQNTALFSLLGTTYGGDGRVTFALPNLVDRVPIGAGQGPGLSNYEPGASGGAAAVALGAADMPSHTHQMTASATAALNTTPDSTQRVAVASVRTYGAAQNLVPMQSSSQVGGAPHDNRQPYLGLNFVIALQGIFPPRS
jgi:microcystin-dependent protein